MPSLVDLLNSRNVQFRRHGEHHHVGQGWIGIDCPECSPGWGHFRLGFELFTGRSSCWMCGRVDGVLILSRLCDITLSEAAGVLRQQVPDGYEYEKKAGKLLLPAAGELLDAHKVYLERRGFNPATIQRLWGIQGIGLSSRLQWRILIPIHDGRGRIVSWTTRAIGEAQPKYISAGEEEEDVRHKDILYGAHHARQSVVVCEGPISAWAIGPGAVATCGVGFSRSQMIEMMKYTRRTVCFDAEDDAQRRADQLCRELSAFPGTVDNIVLETGNDPAEAEEAEVEEIRQKFL